MKRTYTMMTRADGVQQRRDRILEAAFLLFGERPYEEVTLAAVAGAAGVSLKTVTRQFGTKDDLVRGCMAAGPSKEEAERAVTVGDVAGAVQILDVRYRLMGSRVRYLDDLAARVPLMAEWVQVARESHLGWLGQVFAPWLEVVAEVRQRRVRALFAATEIRTWWALQEHLGAGADEATAVMGETLWALVRAWREAEGVQP